MRTRGYQSRTSAAWGELTRASFTNHVRKGSHFLMADDGEYILSVIERQFVNTATTLDVSGRDGTLSSSQIAQAGISGT